MGGGDFMSITKEHMDEDCWFSYQKWLLYFLNLEEIARNVISGDHMTIVKSFVILTIDVAEVPLTQTGGGGGAPYT